MLVIAFLTFFILILLGVPIAFSMGLGAVIAIMANDLPLTLISQRLFSGLNTFSLLAIPFFMLAGELMEHGGISKRLIYLSKCLVGHFKGGLGMIDISTSVVFAGVSGSAAADTAAVGSLMIPSMKKNGYPAGLSAVLQAVAGSLGPIIPPSLTAIIFASLTGLSIKDLFLAGVIPGIAIALGLVIVTYIYAKKLKLGGDSKASRELLCMAMKNSYLALLMPFIIIGGILAGLFTPTEAGAIAVIYAFFVGIYYKELNFYKVKKAIINAAAMTAMCTLIISGATVLSWIIAFTRLPEIIISFLTGITDNPYIILFLLVLFLLFIGMFVETIAATIIVAPILMPIAYQYGIDPIQFAIIMIVVLVYAGVTPPVGGVLFITMGIAEVKLDKTLKYLLPYLSIVFFVILLMILFPSFSLWIPRVLS